MPKGKKKKEQEDIQASLRKTHHKFDQTIVRSLNQFSNLELIQQDKTLNQGLCPWIQKSKKQFNPQIQLIQFKRNNTQSIIGNMNGGNFQLKKLANINKINQMNSLKSTPKQPAKVLPNIQKHRYITKCKSLVIKKITSDAYAQQQKKVQLPTLNIKLKKNIQTEGKSQFRQKIVKIKKKSQSLLNLARIEQHVDLKNFLWKQCTYKI